MVFREKFVTISRELEEEKERKAAVAEFRIKTLKDHD